MRQHADNPVDWWEWGDEAFAEAKRRDVPVFVSIGYATCHWCHVMAHESFEDADVARLMNDAFVCIKVDREERPDVDAAYMAACQAANGSGGWPLNAVVDHERRPWFVGTYFPKTNRGRIGMMELVPKLSEAWQQKRDDVESTAQGLLAHAKQPLPAPGEPNPEWLARAETSLLERHDAENGGFGAAPKFPSAHQLRFLLRRYIATDNTAALTAVKRTLDAMWRGGIHDHVGSGFHRYSTDAGWRLPHFEKMLYDQASLLAAYTEAWQVTQDDVYAAAAADIVAYVTRDLRHPDGPFYCAEDADSEGEEGKFYVWSKDELHAAGVDAEFLAAFQITDEGNFEDEATRQRTGANVLHARSRRDPVLHAGILPTLRTIRDRRVRPQLDDKILTDWNGLMIGALARAGFAFQNTEWIEQARAAARFVLRHCRVDGSLRHRWHDGRIDGGAFLDDHAFLASGLLDLFEATGEWIWLQEAQATADEMLANHQVDGGAFQVPVVGSADVPLQDVQAYDGAIPSGNSIAVDVLDRLGRITADTRYTDAAWSALQALAPIVERAPAAYSGLLTSSWSMLDQGVEIVVGTQAPALREEMTRQLVPGAVMVPFDGANDAPAWLRDYGTDAAYVCRQQTCDAPATSADELRERLQR